MPDLAHFRGDAFCDPPVTAPTYAARVNPADHCANAVRAEPGVCWRIVSRGPGHRVGSPTDCPESVQWVGRAMVGKRRMRLWSCQGHASVWMGFARSGS